MKIQRVVLIAYIGCFFAFGAPAIFFPQWFANLLGFTLSAKGALMEFIAAYGGLIIGIGIYLIYCLRNNIRSGLFAVLTIVGSLMIGRIAGYFVEQAVSDVQVFFLTIELMTIILVSSLLFTGPAVARTSADLR
ncbi:hypothetical protein A9Q99_18115 [Gammaproteobacteria bacterium 45_16_T64]|nr:hypothetical protein A9Q99_18115 [Gammaproteobacteria bacterium 45_16_T64]